MKLFGNTSARPRVAVEEHRSETLSETAARPKKDRFRTGYRIYVLCFLLLIAAGLLLLWKRMDVYERSRPERAVETWAAGFDAAGWRALLSEKGVEESYLDTLELSAAEYYKKLDTSTAESPAFGLRFGKKTMLTVSLAPGEALGFGSHGWGVGAVALAPSGLTVYAPEDAAVAVGGVPVGADRLVQRDAQPLELSVFERGRTDIPGLAKFALDEVFTVERVTVTDAAGNALALAQRSGDSYYYPPLTTDYTVIVPAAARVMVNGVEVTEENAPVTRERVVYDAYRVFEGIEDSVPVSFADQTRCAWVVAGLTAEPEIVAVMPDGTALTAEVSGDVWEFPWEPEVARDTALAEELNDYILDVFDAYVAYLGNRGGNFEGNYSRYTAYLVPGSDAAERARRARESVVWAKGQNTHPDAELGEVLRYSADCFTARVDYTPEDAPGGEVSSDLFVFVRQGARWRVVRVLNL